MNLLTALFVVQAQTPVLPEWIVGCWETQSGTRKTVECWSPPNGPVMSGESVTTLSGKVVEREAMQIVHGETDDPAVARMSFWAIPSGQARTRFDWERTSETGLTFVNRAHDYPQRIRYWREGKLLMAEISAADGTKARRWRYSAKGR